MLAKCAQKPKPADHGKALIDDWRQSGLTQAAYARQYRIGTLLMTYWSKKFPESSDATAEADSSDQAAEAAPTGEFIQLAMCPSRCLVM
jgi:hypothetical protein